MKIQAKQFINYIKIERNLSPLTVKLYSRDLEKLSDFFPNKKIVELTKQDIRDYIAFLSDTNSPVTRARKLSCLRSFFKFLAREDLITLNPLDGIDSPKIPQKEPSYLSESEYLRLLETVKKEATIFYRKRDLAIISLFLSTGIRVSELTGLRIGDVDFQEKFIKIIRKGNKEQTLPINDSIVDLLKKYFKIRPKVSFDDFFVSKKGLPLRSNSAYHLVKKYLLLAGIKKDKMGCHILRHTFCTMLLNKEVNLVAIQELAGHRSLETTRKYLHINSVDLRNAVNKINI